LHFLHVGWLSPVQRPAQIQQQNQRNRLSHRHSHRHLVCPRGGHVFCCLLAAVTSFSSEPIPLLTTASRPGDPGAFSPLPCCSYKILSTAVCTWAHFHDLLPPLLFVLLGCLQFPRSWDASLCSFLVIFFLFFPSPVEKLLCCRRFSIFFARCNKKIGLYLVIVFEKGIKFHLSFSVFRLLAFGTCKDKTHVQIFWQEQPWSTKREWHKGNMWCTKKMQWKLGETRLN